MEIFWANLLLLGSALIHAGWNAAAKLSKDKDPFMLLSVFFACVFVGPGILGLEQNYHLGNQWGVVYAIAAGVFEAGYFLCIAKGFARASLAKTYSVMRGGAMVLVWVVSLALGFESIDTMSLVGSLIVLIGIFISGLEKNMSRQLQLHEMFWPVLGAFFICGYHLCYDKGLHHGAEPKALYMTSLLISLPILFNANRTNFISRAQDLLRREKKLLFISSLGASSSFVIFLYGLQVAGPGHAITLRNTSIFFSIGFAYLIKDRLTLSQLIGAAMVGLGALLLSLAGG